MPNSSRSRPVLPPLSTIDTTAVMSISSKSRRPESSANCPLPPPRVRSLMGLEAMGVGFEVQGSRFGVPGSGFGAQSLLAACGFPVIYAFSCGSPAVGKPRSDRGWKPLPQNLNLLADEALPQAACNANQAARGGLNSGATHSRSSSISLPGKGRPVLGSQPTMV